MRTLYITNTYLQGRSGVVNASKAFVNAFAELSEAMTVVYPQQNGYEVEDVDGQNVELYPVDDHRNKVAKFCSLVVGKMHRYSKETVKLFDREKFDVAVFDTSIVSSRLIEKARRKGLKVITIHHNYEMEYIKGDTRTLLKYPLLFWTSKYEKQAVRSSNLNLTLTETDAKSLMAHYDKNGKFDVLGTFEFKKDIILSAVDTHERSSMVFVITGQLYSIQTEQSLIPWIERYYSLLKCQYPSAKVVIAGRNPSDTLIETCRDHGIEIIPSPKDIDAIVKVGDYYICPTELGSGLKLRIMDGLKQGLMVLAHERSARGYEEMIEKGVLFSYNDSKSFIDGIINIVERKVSRSDVQNAYLSYFSYEAGVARLRRILKKHVFLTE